MEFVSPILSGLVLLLVAALGKPFKDRLDRLEDRLGRLEEKFDRRFEQLSHELVILRSDLTQVALAVGAKPRRA